MDAGLDLSELTRLRMVLGRVGRVLRQQSADGLTYPQISLIFSIERSQPVTVGELASSEGVTPPAVTRALNELVHDGLAQRAPDPHDRRVSRISLTGLGVEECRRLRRSRDTWLSEHIARLAPDDLRAILDALPALERLCDPELPPSET